MTTCFRFRSAWMTLVLVLLMVAIPTVLVSATGATGPSPIVLSPEEQTLISALLTERGNEGLQPLNVDPTLTLLAQQRCAEMATEQVFGHVTTDGKTVFDLLDVYGITYHNLAETLAMNANIPDAGAQAAKDLISSPKHHATLFDPQYTTVGFGHAIGADGTQYFAVIMLS